MEYLQYLSEMIDNSRKKSFKPYYKWNTFNTNSHYQLL